MMENFGIGNLSLHFNPFLSAQSLGALVVCALLVLVLSGFKTRKFSILRGLTFLAFVLALLNPSIHQEQRQAMPNIVAVIIDASPSQDFGARSQRAEAAFQYVEETLTKIDNIEMRSAHAPITGSRANKTELFSALNELLADVPAGRRAGVILITDGQIHDIPDAQQFMNDYGPVHVLLTGDKDEKDRRITITNAPAFGIVGKTITVKYRIDEAGTKTTAPVTLTVRAPDGQSQNYAVPIGEEQTLELPVPHAGQNVFELSAETSPDELTTVNNKAALDFQGVRDRLRVLLVSGKPHAGGRTWRDLLTSDPSVDLVHFTILREPEKVDATPQNEMSLIAFPFRELFEVKLYDFDLIIFDRYRLSRVLPDYYFANIARYVREGGAFLEASGPDYAGENSIYFTALKDIFPGAPNGKVMSESFIPQISPQGLKHPVTQNLHAHPQQGIWGPWQRQVGLDKIAGDVLMTGIDDNPLLVLNRVDKGRVAQIASDHMWLWSRDFKGGGPHAELLRRIVHWLMKEPELDEQALHVEVNGFTVTLRRPDYGDDKTDILMVKPDGTQEPITLESTSDGFLQHRFTADQTGIYSFETGDDNRRFAIIGEVNPLEYRNVLTSPEPMAPITEKSGGGALWLADTPNPGIKLAKAGQNFFGKNWIALQDNDAFLVTGASEKPLLAPWISLLILLTLIIATWWREGRS